MEPDDRVLALSIPEPGIVSELCSRAGALVCLGTRDEVYEARRTARDLRNAMFHPGPAEEVPFDDGHFNTVVDFCCQWQDPAAVAREVERVLIGGGRAYLATEATEPFAAAGLVEEGDEGGLTALRKPPEPKRERPPLELPVLP